jgi:hypothetical protein
VPISCSRARLVRLAHHCAAPQLQKAKMKGDVAEQQTWAVSVGDLEAEEGQVVGVAYDGESFPATVSFYTEKSGTE